MSDPHACCPTCGRCVRCGLDQIPKIEPVVPFKPVPVDWWKTNITAPQPFDVKVEN